MRLLAAALFAMSVLVAPGCTRSGSDARPTIVASFYPLAWAAERVAGNGYRVVNMTPAGAEPHDIELSPRDVEKVRDADLVVYLSGGFQPAVEEAVADRDGPSVDARGGDADPHVWLDPVRFSRVVAELGRALGRPEAARRVEAELRELDRRYRVALRNCTRSTFVTDHAAFGHLARRYGLTQLALTGVSPEAEPLLSNRLAETVAREAGVHVSSLDPIEGLSAERLDEGADYESVMLDDLNALAKALGCR